ncbi:hypothetical protein ACGFYP_03975 [Streptomyces sp. NPDC048370]|uniref:hypothetical protein n=1 Tax=Streptomyces sp. NPDC048370 TaxID=3365540 RepID=UPI003724104D
MSDEIHIIPAGGQSAEEVAEVFAKAAEARGMDADAISVDGGEVILPQDIAANLRTNLRSFPPVNQTYTLQEPMQLSDKDGLLQGGLQGFDVMVNHDS